MQFAGESALRHQRQRVCLQWWGMLQLANAHLRAHSFTASNLAMITDARNQPWPLDIPIDHQSAGLKMPSVLRMKFFTLDNRLVIRSIGRLSPMDRQKLLDSLRQITPPLETSAERAAP
jgi:mRNA interferase MazF